MREIHYELYGYMVKDTVILDWYKGYKKQTKKEKKIDGRVYKHNKQEV